jgi:hypothetical protein
MRLFAHLRRLMTHLMDACCRDRFRAVFVPTRWLSRRSRIRLQITDILSIVTTPTLASLPLSYNNTELAFPLCRSGVDFAKTDQMMSWYLPLSDFAGGVTLYRRAGDCVASAGRRGKSAVGLALLGLSPLRNRTSREHCSSLTLLSPSSFHRSFHATIKMSLG